MEHGTWFSLLIIVVLSGLILWKILHARGGKELFIRKIPGIDAIDEAVGRATEMGRPILFSTGLGGLDIVTLQALSLVGHVARLAARYRTRVIVPMVDTVVLPVAEEICREAYQEAGQPDAFNPDDVCFLSGSQFAYASGVVGIMNRERVAASFLFGSFFAESLILAETGQQVGAVQVAGTPSPLQIPFFITACDYTIIGEEYYATTAYLSREPTLVGSLVGQDYGKIFLTLSIVVGLITTLFLGRQFPQPALDWEKPTTKHVAMEAASLPIRPPVEREGAYLRSPQAEGTVTFPVHLRRGGDYTLWARLGARQGRVQGFEAQVDQEAPLLLGGTPISDRQAEWQWVRGPTYELKAGGHRVTFRWQEAGARLHQVALARWKPWYQHHPDGLAFQAATVRDLSPPLKLQDGALVSDQAGATARFAFKLHQPEKGEPAGARAYTLWLQVGVSAAPETQAPRPAAFRVQLDGSPPAPVEGEAGWVRGPRLTLAPGQHELTVEWTQGGDQLQAVALLANDAVEAANLADVVGPLWADCLPSDGTIGDILVPPSDRYTRLWQPAGE